MIEGAMITGGVCLSYWMNYGFHYLPSSLSWRFPIAFQMVFAIVICLVVLDLPESPRWLIKKGRLEEGKKVIDRIYGDASSEIKQADFDEVCTEISATQGTSWRSLIDNSTQTRNLHRFILGLTHSIFHQICGINLVIYYAPKIYQESLGLTADQTRIVSACVNGTAYFFTSFIATGLIERMGRRKLMFIGTAGQGLGMSALAGCSAYSYIPSAAAAAAAMIFFIQASFAIGWLAIAWLYPAEIVPTQIRAQANGIIVAVTWLFNFFVSPYPGVPCCLLLSTNLCPPRLFKLHPSHSPTLHTEPTSSSQFSTL